jgi:hypothetical protein
MLAINFHARVESGVANEADDALECSHVFVNRLMRGYGAKPSRAKLANHLLPEPRFQLEYIGNGPRQELNHSLGA